jgi:hypothetical protein
MHGFDRRSSGEVAVVSMSPGCLRWSNSERSHKWKEGETNLHCAKYWSTAEAILTGLSITEEGCTFHGPWKVYKEHDEHLTVWTHQRIEQPFGTDLFTGFKQDFLSLQDWVWPNGAQQRNVGHYPQTVGEG